MATDYLTEGRKVNKQKKIVLQNKLQYSTREEERIPQARST